MEYKTKPKSAERDKRYKSRTIGKALCRAWQRTGFYTPLRSGVVGQ